MPGAPSPTASPSSPSGTSLQGVPGLQYPLGGPEKLVGALFLSGNTSHQAWQAKLSLLAYWLADGAFLQPQQLAAGFR